MRLALFTVVALGWWVVPDDTINLIVPVVGVLVRHRVVPLSKLR
ncbi:MULTISPECIES: hypothetical protein [Actinomycetes]|nr:MULTISPECIES: hypothetical protein [Actinomycetes]